MTHTDYRLPLLRELVIRNCPLRAPADRTSPIVSAGATLAAEGVIVIGDDQRASLTLPTLAGLHPYLRSLVTTGMSRVMRALEGSGGAIAETDPALDWASELRPTDDAADIRRAVVDQLVGLGVIERSGGVLYDVTGDAMRQRERGALPTFPLPKPKPKVEKKPVTAKPVTPQPAATVTPQPIVPKPPTAQIEPDLAPIPARPAPAPTPEVAAPKPTAVAHAPKPTAPAPNPQPTPAPAPPSPAPAPRAQQPSGLEPATRAPVAAPPAPVPPLPPVVLNAEQAVRWIATQERIAAAQEEHNALMAGLVGQGRLEPSAATVEHRNRLTIARRIAVLLSYHGEMTKSAISRTKLSSVQVDDLDDALEFGLGTGAFKRVSGRRWALVDASRVGLDAETIRAEHARIVERAAQRAAREAERQIAAARDAVVAR